MNETWEAAMTTIPAASGREPDKILAQQRAAFVREGPPSLSERRTDLRKMRAAIFARRATSKRALDADFGHRSRQR
jgi:coniferyl-aldehyde dehydrogenase